MFITNHKKKNSVWLSYDVHDSLKFFKLISSLKITIVTVINEMQLIYLVVVAIVEQGLLRFYDAIIQGVLRHFNFDGMCACI